MKPEDQGRTSKPVGQPDVNRVKQQGQETGESGDHAVADALELSGTGILAAWLLSVMVHVALFIVMFLIPWISGMVQPDDLPIPETTLIDQLHPDSPLEASPTIDAEAQLIQDEMVEIKPKTYDPLADAQTPESSRPDLSVLGIGAGGGDTSDLGLDVGLGQSGPSFFGIGGRARGARRIVYVVDRSGSMLDTLCMVQKELKRSIGALRRSRRFHVIFYSSGPYLENKPGKLVAASPSQKDGAYKFIDSVMAGGGTDPMMAMERAFEVNPDLIYFLSDGEIPRAHELMGMLDDLNKNRKVRIFTIAYVNAMGADLLEKIARDHKGEFKYVGIDEIDCE